MELRQISQKIRAKAQAGALGTMLLALTVSAQSQAPAGTATGKRSATRACSANPVLGSAAPKKGEHKPKHTAPPEPLPACIEVKGEGIEVQEFLQTRVREQAWRIGENRASEDSWSFVRYFDPDELEKFADTKVLLEPVKFTSGKAALTVRTTDIGDGYNRVQISARFQGEGKSSDKILGQPSTQWPLNSKGVLEQELITALQTGYKPME